MHPGGCVMCALWACERALGPACQGAFPLCHYLSTKKPCGRRNTQRKKGPPHRPTCAIDKRRSVKRPTSQRSGPLAVDSYGSTQGSGLRCGRRGFSCYLFAVPEAEKTHNTYQYMLQNRRQIRHASTKKGPYRNPSLRFAG